MKQEEGEGRTLRKLWGLLARDTLLAFKSTERPYRTGDLDRLCAHLHLHYAGEPNRLEQRSDLCGVLVVATRTLPLDADASSLGLLWRDRGDGYWELEGGLFALYALEIDVVAEAEDDDLLRVFGHNPVRTIEARQWMSEQMASMEDGVKMSDREGYDEVLRKMPDGRPPTDAKHS